MKEKFLRFSVWACAVVFIGNTLWMAWNMIEWHRQDVEAAAQAAKEVEG